MLRRTTAFATPSPDLVVLPCGRLDARGVPTAYRQVFINNSCLVLTPSRQLVPQHCSARIGTHFNADVAVFIILRTCQLGQALGGDVSVACCDSSIWALEGVCESCWRTIGGLSKGGPSRTPLGHGSVMTQGHFSSA